MQKKRKKKDLEMIVMMESIEKDFKIIVINTFKYLR